MTGFFDGFFGSSDAGKARELEANLVIAKARTNEALKAQLEAAAEGRFQSGYTKALEDERAAEAEAAAWLRDHR